MGFRDLSKFNIAMLAKQAWRILQNPESLLSRVFRARIIRERSEMEHRGGTHVLIWEDFWLPGRESRLVDSPRVGGLFTVNDLMNQNSREWNVQLIRQHFNQQDSTAILSIPLTASPLHDKLVWRGERTGLYTVRSGYRMLLNNNQATIEDKQTYKLLWSAECPSKVRIFTWKSIWNYIPTFQNLHRKRISPNARCARCNSQTESLEHVFRECLFSQQLWHCLGVTWPAVVGSLTYFEWLSWLFKHTGGHSIELVIYTVWAIWHSRNKYIHEGKISTVIGTTDFIRGCVIEYKDTLGVCSGPRVIEVVHWSPPLAGFFKINVDASCVPAEHKAFSGFLIRDENGQVMGSGILPQPTYISVLQAEAWAAKQGVEFAIELGFQCLILESDSRTLITKLQATMDDSSEIRIIIADIKSLVQQIPCCRFVFSPRSGNKSAHSLAAFGKEGVEGLWIEDVPNQVLHVVEADRP
ncbi:hypothetical protein like AT4G29090 [Hibiscus trionum]|uniref:RNase H type-1 domain-containing protein n=1 Tax=Hibiscus trionum TaxID=183268 RepID=A0A9W7I6X3_HIBTR|nr:hypothetical protein like AT4G29090 [Hibiscus trionum]